MQTITASRKTPATLDKKPTLHQLPREERHKIGKEMREKCPRESHSKWKAPEDRRDPVELIMESNNGRIENLIPLRHGRMAASPFTFYRGAALNMAADLASTPITGKYVQACGDAHLCNFGGFATPERNVIFSINDLDETLPAPWEWDLKRLAASFVVACRNNQIHQNDTREIILNCVRAYRENMAAFGEMQIMDLWNYSLTAKMMISKLKDPKLMKHGLKRVEKEINRSRAEEIFPQIVKGSRGSKIIKDEIPLIYHIEHHIPGYIDEKIADVFRTYSESLPPGFKTLLDRYTLKDIAIKVVGVGSVGTACWVFLLLSGDDNPLFLQAKQARTSVLEPYA